MKRMSGFASGMTTDVDVRRLEERFGVPDVGAVVSYSDVSDCLRLERDVPRFRTVTMAWRKKLEREHNLLIVAVPNEGFKALDNPGRIDTVSRHYKHGLRRIVKSGDRALKTSDAGLTVEQRRVRDFVSRTAGALKVQAAMEARKLKELPPGTDVGSNGGTQTESQEATTARPLRAVGK